MTPDFNSIKQHLDLLFPQSFAEGEWVCVRGIGEKGTAREGTAADNILIQPATDCPDQLAQVVYQHVMRWNAHGMGAFVVPAVLSRPEAKSDAVLRFHTVCADLDTGNPWSGLKHIRESGIEPALVVASGGTTEQGHDKLHVYIKASREPMSAQACVAARHELASKVGGDPQFGLGVDSNPYGRAHQPIRLAGSVHGKNGKMNLCTIREQADTGYHPEHITDCLRQMQPMPGQERTTKGGTPSKDGAGFQTERPALRLTDTVHEGGDGDMTRFSQFTRVAGVFIHAARRGEITEQEALEKTIGWMEVNMSPAWPMPRAVKEFNGLLRKDIGAHGPMPEPEKPIVPDGGEGLLVWATHRWTANKPPARRFLVDKLVLAGKHQMLVAEGGAGKTFMMLDLALKVACHGVTGEQEWCGHKVNEGGTAVIITTEDDQDELHIRLSEIDPDNRRFAAADRLIVLPLINSGGSFALVERDPRTQESRPSRRWLELVSLLRQLKDLKLVVVDTLNSVMHGEENSATVINEFVRAASVICGELKAALVVTHHIRKQGDEPIRSAEDMASAVRGSSALPAAFRLVLGIWHCSDYERRMQAMGMSPRKKQLWKMAVLKANNPEVLQSELTLLRTGGGLLMDVTDRDVFNSVNVGEREAWLIACIRAAAERGHPYSIEGKNAKSGLYKRRSELPSALKHTGAHEFEHMVNHLMMGEQLVACAAKGTKDKKWLDLPSGPYARDHEGAEMESGAYLDIPDWTKFRYDPQTKRVSA
jgi:hypothetical protein